MESLTTSTLNNVYQVYYNDETRGKCWDGFNLYNNTDRLTEFFENAIIYELCQQGKHQEGEWFGVLSPIFFYKAHRVKAPRFLEQFLLDGEHDALSVNSKSNNPNIITQGDRWHTGFTDLFESIIRKAGIDFEFRHIRNNQKNVFSNYIIARPEIWERYFSTVLKPCMDVMRNPANKGIYTSLWNDAKYHKSRRSQRLRQYLMESYGRPYYTYHTFICERFWTLFLWMNPDVKLKAV